MSESGLKEEGGFQWEALFWGMSRKTLLDVMAVFGSKAGGILVNLVFLPMYQRLLDPVAFGGVTLVISLQALLILIDFGTTLIGHDLSVARASGRLEEGWRTYLESEAFYGLALGAAMGGLALWTALKAVMGTPLSGSFLVSLGFSAGLLLVIALNNLVFAALNALQEYRTASLIQIIGVVARAMATVGVLRWGHGGLKAFLVVQAVTALLHYWIARVLLVRKLSGLGHAVRAAPTGRQLMQLMHRAKPLMLMGAAGAFSTQLDKSIISMNMSLKDVGPYFLAYTYAMVPTAIFGAPMSQYFAPKIFGFVGTGEVHSPEAHRTARFFGLSMAVVTVLPGALLYFYCGDWVGMWLHGAANAAATTKLATTFIFAGAIASLSYQPYILLNAAQDYRYLAFVTTLLTPPLLWAIWFFTKSQNLVMVTWVYIGYYVVALTLNTWRTLHLPSSRILATIALKAMVGAAAGLILLEALLFRLVQFLGIQASMRAWVALGLTGLGFLAASFLFLLKMFGYFGKSK